MAKAAAYRHGKRGKRRVTAGSLRGLKPYAGKTDEELEAIAERMNAGGREAREEFVARFLPRVGIDRMAAEALLETLYDALEGHRAAAARGNATSMRDMGQEIARLVETLRLNERGRSADPARLALARGLAVSEARAALAARLAPLHEREEELARRMALPGEALDLMPEGDRPDPEAIEAEGARLRAEVRRVESEALPKLYAGAWATACALMGIAPGEAPPEWSSAPAPAWGPEAPEPGQEGDAPLDS